MASPMLELRGLAAATVDGATVAGVDLRLMPGEIACVLGDPAAGGRALFEFLAGRCRPRAGSIAVPSARPGRWSAAAAARAGIGVAAGTVLLPGLPIWRSFVAGNEPAIGLPPLRLLRRQRAREITGEELKRLGAGSIAPDTPAGELTPVQRQLVGVARAFWIGSRAVLLNEPTRGLGVDEAANVLHRMLEAREAGIAVLFATGDVPPTRSPTTKPLPRSSSSWRPSRTRSSRCSWCWPRSARSPTSTFRCATGRSRTTPAC